jgi:Mn-dependent DtxR family transcriptional regulator
MNLTKNEKRVLYGLIAYPEFNDSKLSEVLGIKHSTVTSIRHRMQRMGMYRDINVPLTQNIGCEIAAFTYTNFNIVFPLEERINLTSESIEVFNEIFYSMGEVSKGFSINMSKDYTTISHINDIRTEIFSRMNLLAEDHPVTVIFPFRISNVYRFLAYPELLKEHLGTPTDDLPEPSGCDFRVGDPRELSKNERIVYYSLIRYPGMRDKTLGDLLPLSRHTVSNVRKRFETEKLVKHVRVPNIEKMGYNLLVFWHIKINPKKPMPPEAFARLLTPRCVTAVSRKYEAVILSVYTDFETYRTDEANITRNLRSENYIVEPPVINVFDLTKTQIIKDIDFAPFIQTLVEPSFIPE